MANTSVVTITGNLTADPELRFTPSGQATAKMSVAVNRRWQNRQTNNWEEQTSFFNVAVWAQMAENVAQSFTKGDRVVVTGRLEQRTWETEAHEKRSIVEIVADEVAASTRYATLSVSRNERRRPDEGTPVANQPQPYDEEPF